MRSQALGDCQSGLWTAVGGVATGGCYVGMPPEHLTTACTIGGSVFASAWSTTVIGIYAGFGAGKHLITTSGNSSNSYPFGCWQFNTWARSNSNGDHNTNIIDAASCWSDPVKAAQLCRNLGADWYLPSRDELQILYTNRAAIGNFIANNYWSSTENDSHNAWNLNFGNGSWYSHGKNSYIHVRCVRSF